MTDAAPPANQQPSSNTAQPVSRRSVIRAAGAGLVGAGLSPLVTVHPLIAAPAATAASAPAAPATAPAPPALPPLNRFPRMVQEYFVRRVREAEAVGNKRRASLKTRADAEHYVESVRERIRASFGPFPEKTPLNARVTGVVERDVYRIEKVVFESRPDFLVTANLYVPTGRKGPMPGVVGTCGHSDNGKAHETYQSFAQGLARQGYVVLLYDPLGQGERLQYPDAAGFKSRVGAGVAEHLLAGNQQFLVGEFLGAWRVWDGIRALDYLLTRPEVDPRHVGVTGNSGGGTLTTWLCGLDQRWTMAAPSCFVTTFRRNVENELPADTEQCPPRALALGLDHSDFLAALAPRPVIILAQEKDYFDCRGATEAYERVKRLYTLLGAPDDVALFIGPQNHGYSVENREAMYHWFNRATGAVPAGVREPKLTIEKDETLRCTQAGQVSELKSRPIYSFTRNLSQQLAREREPLGGDDLMKAVAETLKLPLREGMPDYRILRPLPSRKYPAKKRCATYAVETEPGIEALVYLLSDDVQHSRPPREAPRAVLYVSHHSADAELRDEPLVREVLQAEPAAAFYACDVRGVGESRPNTCGHDTFLQPYGSDYFYAAHAVMLDYPYVGQRTHDVLGVLDWLKDNGHGDVHLVANGWGTLPATFAAVLSPLVKQVTLKHALTSYAEVAEVDEYRWPLSSLLPGVLQRFDLPDCYRALAKSKNLRQVEPWGAAGG